MLIKHTIILINKQFVDDLESKYNGNFGKKIKTITRM